MSQEWYYSSDGKREGPVSAADLKKLADSGKLKEADLVWKEGMADWAPAKSVKGLFAGGSSAAATPKADDAAASGQRPRPKPAEDEAEEDERPSRSRRRDDDDEEEKTDRPVRRLRKDDDEDEEDRPARRSRDDDDEEEARPRKKRRGGKIPDDVGSKKMVAGILGILLNAWGIHKFYLGMNTAGLIMLLVSLLTCGFGAIIMWPIGLIEGIIYLTKSDEDFYETYIVGQKQWF